MPIPQQKVGTHPVSPTLLITQLQIRMSLLRPLLLRLILLLLPLSQGLLNITPALATPPLAERDPLTSLPDTLYVQTFFGNATPNEALLAARTHRKSRKMLPHYFAKISVPITLSYCLLNTRDFRSLFGSKGVLRQITALRLEHLEFDLENLFLLPLSLCSFTLHDSRPRAEAPTDPDPRRSPLAALPIAQSPPPPPAAAGYSYQRWGAARARAEGGQESVQEGAQEGAQDDAARLTQFATTRAFKVFRLQGFELTAPQALSLLRALHASSALSLETLEISKAYLDEDATGLPALLELPPLAGKSFFPCLSCLIFSNNLLDSELLADFNFVDLLGEHLSHLTELDYSSNVLSEPQTVRLINSMTQSLQALSFGYGEFEPVELGGEGGARESAVLAAFSQAQAQCLRKLHLNDFSVNDLEAQVIADRFTQLTDLKITEARLSQQGAECLLNQLKQLVHIELANEDGQTLGPAVLPEHRCQWQRLRLKNLASDQTVQALFAAPEGHCFSALTELTLGTVNYLTGSGAQHALLQVVGSKGLQCLGAAIHHLPALRLLDLSYLAPPPDGQRLEMTALLQGLRLCRKLQHLNLSGLAFSAQGLRDLGKLLEQGHLPELKTLTLIHPGLNLRRLERTIRDYRPKLIRTFGDTAPLSASSQGAS